MTERQAGIPGVVAPDARRPYGLLAYGDPNIDLVFAVTQAPQADQKVLGRRLGRFAGGTVANAGCAAAALGCRTLAFGRVGGDGDGAFLLEEYARHGVVTDGVRTMEGTASACATIMIEPNGEKALVYAPLPAPPFEPAALRAALAGSAIVYATPYDGDEFQALQALARAAGARIAIDIEGEMASRPGGARRLLALADVVFMNEATYRCLFGGAPEVAAMRGLLEEQEQGAQLLVVTRGAAGALAATRHAHACAAAFPATMVDSTGAGDCFNGAFLAALLEGASLEQCLRFACAAASFAVAQLGARSGIARRSQVEALLASA